MERAKDTRDLRCDETAAPISASAALLDAKSNRPRRNSGAKPTARADSSFIQDAAIRYTRDWTS
jgi:hypothetical protein